ncbi:efflux RND transporter periplasmic adaptor subunit [Pseudoalteromonas rubra]|uniref:YknX-like C-terminal permuted SH3-like domain-containing protein n=1 Tax=Pseudoalteromonas rubra TaxID=43658 RepID=A0A5S3WYL1_9GAMM|nr:efflux RND transporter periplasmic adaptor subunit [Pseudoalteromonas rubra]TMP36470.1 hypothetical protein CWB98_12615 [Pseudoalteromonas rubra]
MKSYLVIAATVMSLLLVDTGYANNTPAAHAVEASSVTKQTIRDWAFAEGIAQGIRREYLNFESGGKVVFLADDQSGNRLRAGSFVTGPKPGERFGQLLARVDERTGAEAVKGYEASLRSAVLGIEQAQAQLHQAQNNHNLAKTSFERAQSMWERKLIAKERFEAVKTELLNAQQSMHTATAALDSARSQKLAAQAQLNQGKVNLEKTGIFAPFDGQLRTVNIRQGDYWAGPAAVMSDKDRETHAAMVVIDTSQYEVTLNVPYYAADKLAEGQTVYLSWSNEKLLNAANSGFTTGDISLGKIFSVSPSISLSKRAIEVKVHTFAGAQHLKDGMHVSAWIKVAEKPLALSVPHQAVMMRNNQPFVYVINAANKAQLTPVETGIEDLDRIEILSGLSAGQQVVVNGEHLLVHGSAVRVVGVTHE